MGALQPWHLIVLAAVVVALFGYNKLPDVTRSVGRSLRIFKTEMKGLSEDDKVRDEAKANGQVTAAPSVAPVAVDPTAPAAPVADPTAAVAPVHVDPTDDEVARAQAVLAAKARSDAAAAKAAGEQHSAAH